MSDISFLPKALEAIANSKSGMASVARNVFASRRNTRTSCGVSDPWNLRGATRRKKLSKEEQ